MKKLFFTVLLITSLLRVNAQNYWQFITGLPITSALAMESNNNGNVIMGSLSQGLYSTSDNDSVWHLAGLDSLNIHALAKDSNGYLYAGTMFAGLLRSIDNFATTENLGLLNRFINFIEIPDNGFIIAATDTGVYVSKNDGLSWNHSLKGKFIHTALFSKNGIVYALADPGIYASVDTGITWQSFSSGFTANCNATFLYLSENNDLFAGTDSCGLFKYDSIQNLWNHCALDSLHVTFMDENSKHELFVSTYNGPFYSNDNGATWQLLGDTLDRDNLIRIFVNSSDFVYVNVCCGYGIYRSTISSTDSTASISSMGFLNDNNKISCSPNPFNTNFSIDLYIEESENLVVNIFSITGELVYSINGNFNAGEKNTIKISNNLMQNGVYFVSIKTKNRNLIQKIIKI